MKKRLATHETVESPTLCRRVLASLSETVLVVHPRDRRILMTNAAVGDLFGFEPEELVGESTRRLYQNDEDYELFGGRCDEALGAGRTLRTEFPFLRADGGVFVADVTATAIDPDDRSKGVVKIFRDVSTVRRTRAQLESERDRFLKIFRVGPVAMALSDVDTSTFVEVNDRWCEVTGFERDEMIGRSTADLALWEEPEARDRLRGALAADGRVENVRTIIRRRDGTRRVIFGSIQRIRLADRSLWFSTVHDVTDQVRLEQERARMAERQGTLERLGSVGELAGGIAHDLNNLLLPILVNVELALPDAPDTLRAQLQEVREAALRGRELTRKLLAFGRKQTIQKETLDLNDVVRSAEAMLTRLAPDRVVVDRRLGADLPAVDADPVFMEHVLVNLVMNARDAVGDGGRIEISTFAGHPSDDEDRFGRPASDDLHTYLMVSDDGPGIPAELRDKIFEPFFTTKEEGSGTGLGLSSALGIVEQHGGHIVVDTGPGEGASFKVALPALYATADDPPGAAALTTRPADGSEGAGRTVLVVEDDAAVRRVISRVLRSHAFDVVESANGKAAMEVVGSRSDEIDLIISDMVMPGMTGLELRDEVGEVAPEIPVLLVSGYSATVLAEHGVDPDTVRVLEKPFTPARLMRSVMEALARDGGS